jgi:hypothetical protein
MHRGARGQSGAIGNFLAYGELSTAAQAHRASTVFLPRSNTKAGDFIGQIDLSDKKDVPTPTLIAQARQERQRLIDQIQPSQSTIERSRILIARLDEVLSRVED